MRGTLRYKLRKDELHTQITAELQSAGFSVADTSHVGNGFPDLAIARNNVSALVEIKTLKYLPKLAKTRHKTALEHRRASQIEFARVWKGPIIVAFSASEVVHDFNLLLKRREAWAIS